MVVHRYPKLAVLRTVPARWLVLGTVLLAALVLLGLVRPGLKAMMAPKPVPVLEGEAAAGAPGGQLDALVGDDAQRPALTGPGGELLALAVSPQQQRLEDARKLARENPIAVANIVKNWINGESAGS